MVDLFFVLSSFSLKAWSIAWYISHSEFAILNPHPIPTGGGVSWSICFKTENVVLCSPNYGKWQTRQNNTNHLKMQHPKKNVKLRAYAGAVHGLGAHLHGINPWACGGKEPIIPGHRETVTTGLPQFTIYENKVTTPCLSSRTYSLLGEQEQHVRQTQLIFTLPGNRTQRKCARSSVFLYLYNWIILFTSESWCRLYSLCRWYTILYVY